MTALKEHARKAARFFGLNPSMIAVLGMAILVGLGERLGERFVPKYLEVLGSGIFIIGLYGALDNLLSALYAIPGGWLSDKLGTKKALLVFNLFAMIGYAIVILFPVWEAVIVGAIFFTAWESLSLPATMGLVTEVLPGRKRTMGVTMHSLVRRIPMALGPVIGGTLIMAYGVTDGIRLAFVIAFAMGIVSIVVQQLMIKEPKERKPYEPMHIVTLFKRMQPSLRQLLLGDILIRFCEQIPYAFVVLWVMDIAGRTAAEFGTLTAIEMATAVFIYLPVAYFADKTGKKPFVVITFGFFTLFPLILMQSLGLWMLVLAFVIRGLKEFGEPTRKALIVDLCDPSARARMFGAYYFIRDGIVTVAALLGAWLWMLNPQWNLWAAFGFGVLGTIYFALFGRDAPVATRVKD
jgi:MFS family permease